MLLYRRRLYLFFCVGLIIISAAGLYQINQKAALPFNLISSDGYVTIQNENILNGKGAIILKLNQFSVNTIEDIEFVCDGLNIGEEAKLLISQNGIKVEKVIRLVAHYSFNYQFILLITAILFLVFAFIVLFKPSSNEYAALILHFLIISIFVLMTTTWGKYNVQPQGSGSLVRGLFHFAYSLIPIFFFHFTLIFPDIKWKNYKFVLLPLYAVAVLMGVVLSFLFLAAQNDVSLNYFRQHIFLFDVCRSLFAVIVLLSILNFLHSFLNSKNVVERKKLKLIMIGTLVGPLSFLFLWLLPQTFTSHPLVPEEFILLTSTSIPITFSFAIKKYHVFDIDLIFKRTTIYSITLVIILGFYLVIVGTTAVILGNINKDSTNWIPALAAIITALIFEPLRLKLQQIIDKYFYRVKYNYQKVEKKFVQQINNLYNVDTIIDTLLDEVSKIMSPEKIIYCKCNKAEGITGIIMKNVTDEDEVRYVCKILLSNKINTPQFVRGWVESDNEFLTSDKELFDRIGVKLLFPILSVNGEILGFLMIGKKKSDQIYIREDVDVINGLLHHSTIVIEKIELMKTLMQSEEETKKLLELNELKSLFVATVSHDLKTPLTSIKMFTEILESSPQMEREKQERYLSIIHGETQRLNRLIDNVLNTAKIEKGIKEYHLNKADLTEVIKASIGIMEYQLEINGFTLQTNLYKDRLIVNIDADAIQDMIINLISNSIKYSPEVKEIQIESGYFDEKKVFLKIIDKGIGILSEDVDRLLKPFEKTEKKQFYNQSTGLGLAIVKHIVDGHNAKILFKGEANKGTEVTVIFNRGTDEKSINN